MKGLLIKDFRLMRNQMRFILMMLVFCTLFSAMYKNIFFALGYVSSFMAILAVSSISYDEYDNGMAYLFTLPFERKSYVREKYVFSVLLTGIAIGVSAMIAFIVSVIKGTSYELSEWWGVIGMSVFAAVFIIAFTLPVQMKFGSEKSRVAIFVVIIGFFIMAYLIGKITEIVGIDVDAAMSKLMLSPARLTLTVGIGAACVMAVSYIIALKIMKKKEF